MSGLQSGLKLAASVGAGHRADGREYGITADRDGPGDDAVGRAVVGGELEIFGDPLSGNQVAAWRDPYGKDGRRRRLI
ncbi:hypothetical protein ACI2LF_43785 [Kribbella sp. NPDC020789]